MTVLVYRTRRAAQLALLALVLAGAGRLAWTSFDAWWFGEEAALASDDVPTAAAQPAGTDIAADPTSDTPDGPLPELIPMVLSVTHGGARSEVFLDGMPLGHTAFLGDVSCRRGTEITIRIQPSRGEAIERVRRCEGSMIVVKEP